MPNCGLGSGTMLCSVTCFASSKSNHLVREVQMNARFFDALRECACVNRLNFKSCDRKETRK